MCLYFHVLLEPQAVEVVYNLSAFIVSKYQNRTVPYPTVTPPVKYRTNHEFGEALYPRKYIYTGVAQTYISTVPLSGCLYPFIATTSPSFHLLCHPLCAPVPVPSLYTASFYWVSSLLCVLRSLAPQTFLAALNLLVPLALHHLYGEIACDGGSFWPQNNQSLFKHNSFVFQSDICCPPLSPSLPLPSITFLLLSFRDQRWSFLLVLAGVQRAFSYCFRT